MIIGFTGTRYGMTQSQALQLTQLLAELHSQHGVQEFHHGACVGSDAEAHRLIRNGSAGKPHGWPYLSLPGVRIVCHPGPNAAAPEVASACIADAD